MRGCEKLWTRAPLNLRWLSQAHNLRAHISLEDPSAVHHAVSLNLLSNQIAELKNLSVDFFNKGERTNLDVKRQLDCCMQARQLTSIHLSELHLRKRRGKARSIMTLKS
eukprot:696832-Pelagomonas_calceolata.AAC.2